MSRARIHYVGRAAKPQGQCGSCRNDINKGDSYLWWTVGFRSRAKYRRCRNPKCAPQPSELESSKAATLMAAVEGNAVSDEDTAFDLTEKHANVLQAAEEVRDEYQEAQDGMGGYNSQMEEYIYAYDDIISNLESWDGDVEDPANYETEAEYQDALGAARDSLKDLFEGIEYP